MLSMRFDSEKAIEAILYIASNAPNPDLYHVGKILYFADRIHLEQFGRLIAGDSYIAMKDGPVASATYDILKKVRGDGCRCPDGCDVEHAKASFHVGGADQSHRIFPKRNVDLDVFSASDIRCIDEAIAKYGCMSFGELKEISHDDVWNSADMNSEIPLEVIALACRDGESLLQHLKEAC